MPIDIPLSWQNITVVLVIALAVAMLWRINRKPRQRGCPGCPANPATRDTHSDRTSR